MAGAHSRFGGSKADRWMNCVGSTALCDSVPPIPEGPYAREGSAAHDLARISLQKDQHPRDFIGLAWTHDGGFAEPLPDLPGLLIVTQEMVDAVVVYLNCVTHEFARTKDAELYVEQGFVLDVASADEGEVFGTNDAMVYHPSTGRLVVFDYKHGVGVSVSAEDNAQLKFYAAGAVFSKPEWRIGELELVIVQPRSRDLQFLPDDADPELKRGIKRWPMDPLALMDFQADVDDAIAKAKDVMLGFSGTGLLLGHHDDLYTAPRLAVGSWCKWCDAAAVCPLKEKQVLEAAHLAFDSITDITADALPEPKTFDTDRLGDILKAGKILNDWLSQIESYVEAQVLAGVPIKGWKAVEKIGRAKWVSADADVLSYAEMMFGIDLSKTSLETITTAEKMLKSAGATKDQIDDFKLRFTIKESSGLTIAPESDRRPAVNAAERAFGSVNIDSI